MLSLHVAKVNAGIGAAALVPGMHLPACVRSMEDHGFLLTTGIQVRSFTGQSCVFVRSLDMQSETPLCCPALGTVYGALS